MPRWLDLTSPAMSSTASGTTPSRQDRQIKLLFPDRPLALKRTSEAAHLMRIAMLSVLPAFSRIGEENAFAVLARATELANQGRDIINLGIGQPDFPTPPHIVEAAVKALHDGHHGYTPATGILPLREAVTADIDRRIGAKVSPDDVIIVPGGKITMFMAILMFGEPGADILYP